MMPKYVPKSQVGDLLASPNADTWTGRRDRLAMLLMLRCGLRVSEAFGLRRDQVRRLEDRVELANVTRKATVKHSGRRERAYRQRSVPCPPDVAKQLLEWLRDDLPRDAVYLLPTRTGRQVHRVDAYKMVRRHAESAGLDETHPHMLRHSFASQALQEGFTMPEVSRLLGHASLRSTMVYLHPDDDVIAEKMKEWDRGDR